MPRGFLVILVKKQNPEMIYHLEGKITEKSPAHVIIDVNGTGYYLHVSLYTYTQISNKQSCKLYTESLYIRDDLPRMYGFFDIAERNLFRLLVSVSGVGGNSAMLLLSSLSIAEIHQGILSGNVAMFKKVKGIGEKTAQRIIVDLKGKLGKDDSLPGEFFNEGLVSPLKQEALAALITLGFDKNKASDTLDKILSVHNNLQVEQLIKTALKNM
jgi:Holliday junction DNA helicase RuvA